MTRNEGLRLLRLRYGLQQLDMGLSRPTVSDIEAGRRSVTLRIIDTYAKALGVRPADVLQAIDHDLPETHVSGATSV